MTCSPIKEWNLSVFVGVLLAFRNTVFTFRIQNKYILSKCRQNGYISTIYAPKTRSGELFCHTCSFKIFQYVRAFLTHKKENVYSEHFLSV